MGFRVHVSNLVNISWASYLLHKLFIATVQYSSSDPAAVVGIAPRFDPGSDSPKKVVCVARGSPRPYVSSTNPKGQNMGSADREVGIPLKGSDGVFVCNATNAVGGDMTSYN